MLHRRRGPSAHFLQVEPGKPLLKLVQKAILARCLECFFFSVHMSIPPLSEGPRLRLSNTIIVIKQLILMQGPGRGAGRWKDQEKWPTLLYPDATSGVGWGGHAATRPSGRAQGSKSPVRERRGGMTSAPTPIRESAHR